MDRKRVRQIEDACVRNHEQMLACMRSEPPVIGRRRGRGHDRHGLHYCTAAAASMRASTLARLAAAAGDNTRARGRSTNSRRKAARSAAVRSTQRKRRSYCHLARVSGSALDWRMKGGIRIDVEFPSSKELDLEWRANEGLDAVCVKRNDFDQVLQIGHRPVAHTGVLAERQRIVGRRRGQLVKSVAQGVSAAHRPRRIGAGAAVDIHWL